MVNAPATGLRNPGSSPGQGHCVVFLGKTLNLSVPLSTQVYKWVPAKLMIGVTLQWTSIPEAFTVFHFTCFSIFNFV